MKDRSNIAPPRWLSAVIPDGIRGRLFLLIVLVLVPLTLLIAWNEYDHYRTQRAETTRTEHEVASGVAATFQAYVEGIWRHSHTVADGIVAARGNESSIAHILRDAAAQYPSIRNLSWVGPDGMVIYSTEPRLVGRDFSIRDYFRRIQAGARRTIGSLTPSGIVTPSPTFAIATAFRARDGTLLGAVVAGIEPTRLGELNLVRYGSEDDAYAIFDQEGVLSFRSTREPLAWEERVQWQRHDPILTRALETGLPESGIARLGGGAEEWLAARVSIGTTGWIAGAARPLGEALAPLRRQFAESMALATAATALAFLVAYLVARTIAYPLQRLARDAQDLGTGGTIRPRTDDPHAPVEVRRLRRDVETMAADLIRRAEALSESEARFRHLADALPQLVWTADPDGRVDYYNERQREYRGFAETPGKGYQWAPVLHEDDRQATIEEWSRAVRTGTTYQIEHRAQWADGSYRWVLSRAVPVRDQEGRIVKWFGTATDIHDMKLAEAALRRERSQIQAILEFAPVLISIKDLNAKILVANPAMLDLMNLPPGERLEGRNLFDLLPAEHAREIWDSEQEALRRGGPIRVEETVRAKDKSRHVYLTVKFPVRDVDTGEPFGICSISTDITALKQAEQALRESELRFRALADNISQLAWMADGRGRIVWYNKRWFDFTGATPEDMRRRSWTRFHHPDHLHRVMHKVRHAVARGEAWEDTFPLKGRSGEYRWFLAQAVPIRDDQGKVVRWFGTNTDITERRQMEESIRHMAQHDALTGLPNRRMFLDIIRLEMAQASRNARKLGILFLDLDRFKQINDTFGHEAGDQLLVEVATRLRESVRGTDTIARIGGDEFNIIVSDVQRPMDITEVVRKIVDGLREPFTIAGQEVHVTSSVGISIFPDDGRDVDALLRYADIAMYYAKEHGRNTFQFYNTEINSRSIERIRLENMLCNALERGELVMLYQPQVDVGSREVVCVEALARWRHPERGLLDPEHFIGVAEEIGLIDDIDNWAIRTACTHAKAWSDADLRPIRVTVNVSARHFRRPDMTRSVARIVEETGVSPGAIDIEITESTAMSDIAQTAERLTELKAMGMHVVIDDFGTGYSSLNYLKRLPIEKLKIDKSFVHDIATDRDDRAIIRAITAMAHTMNIRVLAEGVETEDQLAFLKENHCDEAQGFLFSPPLTDEKLREFVRPLH